MISWILFTLAPVDSVVIQANLQRLPVPAMYLQVFLSTVGTIKYVKKFKYKYTDYCRKTLSTSTSS